MKRISGSEERGRLLDGVCARKSRRSTFLTWRSEYEGRWASARRSAGCGLALLRRRCYRSSRFCNSRRGVQRQPCCTPRAMAYHANSCGGVVGCAAPTSHYGAIRCCHTQANPHLAAVACRRSASNRALAGRDPHTSVDPNAATWFEAELECRARATTAATTSCQERRDGLRPRRAGVVLDRHCSPPPPPGPPPSPRPSPRCRPRRPRRRRRRSPRRPPRGGPGARPPGGARRDRARRRPLAARRGSASASARCARNHHTARPTRSAP